MFEYFTWGALERLFQSFQQRTSVELVVILSHHLLKVSFPMGEAQAMPSSNARERRCLLCSIKKTAQYLGGCCCRVSSPGLGCTNILVLLHDGSCFHCLSFAFSHSVAAVLMVSSFCKSSHLSDHFEDVLCGGYFLVLLKVHTCSAIRVNLYFSRKFWRNFQAKDILPAPL